VTIIPLTIGLSVTGKNRFRQTGYRFRKINGLNIPRTIIVTDAWAGYNNIDWINNGVYQHAVEVHVHNFVDPHHAEGKMQAIEGTLYFPLKPRGNFNTKAEWAVHYLQISVALATKHTPSDST